MSIERAIELLNNVVNWIAISENISTQIKTLLEIGFTSDELINQFNYDENDVLEAKNN
jgi:hypothetical protein